ncbi:hypothetical protein [Rhizobium sp. AAP43]|uniref:hypothetical protein n=1 Tax=Rhizobium sp. AAP43 TaxID=1523420 RepID=UPI0006B9B30A|nr:hypothetical protein [Rhizobium sp. AAP43]KPF42754.1 hypothetical protein IP76_16350 [Rhizobium sp. AAP43]
MVTGDGAAPGWNAADRELLRSLLRRSDYATSDLDAKAGPDHDRETVIIGRILEGMIQCDGYPSSEKQRMAADREALLCWEDEGGSIGVMDLGATSTAGDA